MILHMRMRLMRRDMENLASVCVWVCGAGVCGVVWGAMDSLYVNDGRGG